MALAFSSRFKLHLLSCETWREEWLHSAPSTSSPCNNVTELWCSSAFCREGKPTTHNVKHFYKSWDKCSLENILHRKKWHHYKTLTHPETLSENDLTRHNTLTSTDRNLQVPQYFHVSESKLTRRETNVRPEKRRRKLTNDTNRKGTRLIQGWASLQGQSSSWPCFPGFTRLHQIRSHWSICFLKSKCVLVCFWVISQRHCSDISWAVPGQRSVQREN